MTREEYNDFANALKNNYTIDFDKLPEFCDMAISALSAEGEYIKKEDAIAEFKAQKDSWEYYGESFYNEKYIKFDDVIQTIEGMPTHSLPDSAEKKGE